MYFCGVYTARFCCILRRRFRRSKHYKKTLSHVVLLKVEKKRENRSRRLPCSSSLPKTGTFYRKYRDDQKHRPLFWRALVENVKQGNDQNFSKIFDLSSKLHQVYMLVVRRLLRGSLRETDVTPLVKVDFVRRFPKLSVKCK